MTIPKHNFVPTQASESKVWSLTPALIAIWRLWDWRNVTCAVEHCVIRHKNYNWFGNEIQELRGSRHIPSARHTTTSGITTINHQRHRKSRTPSEAQSLPEMPAPAGKVQIRCFVSAKSLDSEISIRIKVWEFFPRPTRHNNSVRPPHLPHDRLQ